MKRSALFFAAAVGAVALVAMACDGELIRDKFCSDIPEGGCPEAVGDACEDPTCSAVYRCNRSDDSWTQVTTCPPQEGGAPEPTTDAGRDGSSDALPLDAAIDAPPGAFGGPGCASLELPDCPLAVALICAPGCCGCEDLFVCENGGWNVWGTCQDGVVRQVRSSAPAQR